VGAWYYLLCCEYCRQSFRIIVTFLPVQDVPEGCCMAYTWTLHDTVNRKLGVVGAVAYDRYMKRLALYPSPTLDEPRGLFVLAVLALNFPGENTPEREHKQKSYYEFCMAGGALLTRLPFLSTLGRLMTTIQWERDCASRAAFADWVYRITSAWCRGDAALEAWMKESTEAFIESHMQQTARQAAEQALQQQQHVTPP
jgi:hypothetical protein